MKLRIYLLSLLTTMLIAGCSTPTSQSNSSSSQGTESKNASAAQPTVFLKTKTTKEFVAKPVNDMQRTVYIQVENNSNKPDFYITEQLIKDLTDKGYRVVQATDKAHYLLEIHVIDVSENDPHIPSTLYKAGYGSRLDDTFSREVLYNHENQKQGKTTQLFNQIIGKGKIYYVVTDVRISIRSRESIRDDSLAQQAKPANDIQAYFNNVSHWNRIYARWLSKTPEVSMDYEQAKPLLEQTLAQQLANVLA